jgi:hypothetical protein
VVLLSRNNFYKKTLKTAKGTDKCILHNCFIMKSFFFLRGRREGAIPAT